MQPTQSEPNCLAINNGEGDFPLRTVRSCLDAFEKEHPDRKIRVDIVFGGDIAKTATGESYDCVIVGSGGFSKALGESFLANARPVASSPVVIAYQKRREQTCRGHSGRGQDVRRKSKENLLC
jgi:hypothetical protein